MDFAALRSLRSCCLFRSLGSRLPAPGSTAAQRWSERASRASRAHFVALLLQLTAGCNEQTLVVQIPFEEQHRSAMVAVEYRDEVQLFSVDEAARNDTPILRSIEGWDDEDPIALSVSL